MFGIFKPRSVNAPVQILSTPVAAQPVPSSPSPAPAFPQSIDIRAENVKSVISEREQISGNLKFRRGLKVDGTVEGNIEFGLDGGLLVVNHSARITRDIFGPKAIGVGEVDGNIMITGRLILLPSARVHGDIIAGALQIQEGATIDGGISSIADSQRTIDAQRPNQDPATAPQTADVRYIR